MRTPVYPRPQVGLGYIGVDDIARDGAKLIVSRSDVEAALPAYDLGVQIGQGGFGVVLSARHRGLDRPVAVKVMSRDQDHGLNFSAEARILATLDHPHIVRVFDYVETTAMHVIIMELLPGGTLKQRIITEEEFLKL